MATKRYKRVRTPRLRGKTWTGPRKNNVERDGNIQDTTSRWMTEWRGSSQPKNLSKHNRWREPSEFDTPMWQSGSSGFCPTHQHT